MSDQITISDYLLSRLTELGIDEVFGVPGDYNLVFLDQVMNFPKLKWIGNCNELNAAYAADGYARVKGAAAVVTTFGVGELSAINGIAGSYAEYLPVIKITGSPALSTQTHHEIMHHTYGTGDFSVFAKMFEHVTTAHTILTPQNACAEIDRVLQAAWIKKQPAYISIPSDIVLLKVNKPQHKLNLHYPTSNKDAIQELVSRINKRLQEAKNPVALIDICAARHPMRDLITQFIEKSGLPFANMNMGKGLLNESHPQFIGNYSGEFSSEGVQDVVENSDCIISFGWLMSDFNTGGFSTKIDANATIEIHSHYVKVRQSVYNNVYFDAVIPTLNASVSKHAVAKNKFPHPNKMPYQAEPKAITQERFWLGMSHFFQANDIILGETGTSMFGLLPAHIPDGVTFIGQALWGSIGYAVGALLGAAIADRKRRAILFVGDGSFQLTAQEVSTMIRQKLTPIIFLLNNDGYTIERAIHGATMEYNDVQMWDYTAFAQSLGKNVWTSKVKTETELAQVLQETKKHTDQLCFIEVFMDRMDCPEMLRKIGEACERRNQGG